jgi:hypothetical protein
MLWDVGRNYEKNYTEGVFQTPQKGISEQKDH